MWVTSMTSVGARFSTLYLPFPGLSDSGGFQAVGDSLDYGVLSLRLREGEPGRLEDGFHVGVLVVSVLLSWSNRLVWGIGLDGER